LALGGQLMEQLAPEDRNVVARARRLERFLTQPFFATEKFSGIKGKIVSLKDSLDGCERILRDEFKDYPESALYMIGTIGEAKGQVNPAAAASGTASKTAAKADPKPARKSSAKATAELQLKPEAESRPKT